MSILAATILLAQLRCSPSASGSVDCFDVQKGGAPVLKVEPNLSVASTSGTATGRSSGARRRRAGRRSVASFRRARSGEPPALVLRSRGVAIIRPASRRVLSGRPGGV